MGISKRLALACSMAACFGAQDHALAQSPGPALLKAHRHPDTLSYAIDEGIPEFSMPDTALAAAIKRENLATDRRRRYEAFTVEDSTAEYPQLFRLFIVDRRTGKTREIRGLPFDWRPFSDLTWADSRTLMFDRWSSPHVGTHYAVDVVSRKLVAVVAFRDR
jgi:hypothetical protein